MFFEIPIKEAISQERKKLHKRPKNRKVQHYLKPETPGCYERKTILQILHNFPTDMNSNPQTPKPQRQHPKQHTKKTRKQETLNPKPSNPKPHTLSQTLNPKPEIPETPNPKYPKP